MTHVSSKSAVDRPVIFEHADEADYAAFLARIPMAESFRRKRLIYRSMFIESWPDIRDWFAAPLPIRIGCLNGDKQAHPTYPVSFRARSYLYYAAMTDRIRLDYDFLFAVGNMRVAETMEPLNAYEGLDALVADSAKIGYSATGVQAALRVVLPRLAMHTGVRSFGDLRQHHLDEMIAGVDAFAARHDTHIFRNEKEDFPAGFQRSWRVKTRVLQLLLFQNGNDVIRPQIIQDKRKPIASPRPDRGRFRLGAE